MIQLGHLIYLARELQRLLPAHDLAIVRVRVTLIDVAELLRYPPSGLPEINVGQLGSRRIPLADGSSLHVHFFRGYIEAHIDATDPSRDPVAHVVEVTHVGLAALAGATVAALTGSWLPILLVTALGAGAPSQRRRVFVLGRDAAGLTLHHGAEVPVRRNTRGRYAPVRRAPW
ncbi:MAG: hypothetical protein E6J91_10470 [Deltaproteobacteria bacterium]|nr:MAG: hypothetical protein E6J91_10470 [Deltaproteobacteria bacterium]